MHTQNKSTAAGHTAGPWKAVAVIETVQDFTHIVLSEACGAIGHSPKRSEHSLGYTRFKEPDARLIAAAPELLEALEAVLDDIGNNGRACKQARAAIARAKGNA